MEKDQSCSKRRSKNKGNAFERLIAKKLAAATGKKFHRTPASGGSGLAVGFRLSGDVVTNDSVWPFCVETKAREGWHLGQIFSQTCAIWKWWEQTIKEANSVGLKPLLIFKKRSQGIYAMMYESDLKNLSLPVDSTTIILTVQTPKPVVILEFETLENWIQKHPSCFVEVNK